MTEAAVTDLHSLVWWGLGKEHRFGAEGGSLFHKADAGHAVIHVPTVVLDHLAAAEEFGLIGVDPPFNDFVHRLFGTGNYFAAPLTPEIIARASTFPPSAQRVDRLLAATAAVMQRPLVSARQDIGHWSGVPVLW